MKLKLSFDESDALRSTLESEGWKSFMRALDFLVASMEGKVLSYNLGDGAEKLVHEKARVEGAHQLRRAIIELKESQKKKFAALEQV